MKWNMRIFVGFVSICFLFLQVGCQQAVKTGGNGGAEIVFEDAVYDFGKVGPSTKHSCEFKFTNTGDEVLEISKVSKTCGCRPERLDKTEFAPGESGSLKVRYRAAGKQGAKVQKRLYIYSNDMANPKTMVAVQAYIVSGISFEPKKMDLSLEKANGGCANITLAALDGQAFSIESIYSTGNCITADFDPAVKAVEFVLEPKVDGQRLRKVSDGAIEIKLAGTNCKKVIIFFNTTDT